MGDEQSNFEAPRSKRTTSGFRPIATLRAHAKTLATIAGAVGTSALLVFNAGRDYQGLKSQVQANTTQIGVLRDELRFFESVLFHLQQPTLERPIP